MTFPSISTSGPNPEPAQNTPEQTAAAIEILARLNDLPREARWGAFVLAAQVFLSPQWKDRR